MIVEFRVEGGREIINWRGGCNSSGTTYTISDGRLHLDQGGASTVVLCNQVLMDQDTLLGQLLSAGPEVTISPSTLRLAESQITITFALTSTGESSLTP
jgi:heat shock protein HslJ